MESHVRQWRTHGWTFFEGLLDRADVIRRSTACLPRMYPTADEFARDVDPRRNDRFRVAAHGGPFLFEDRPGPGYRRLQFAGNEDFPFPDEALNRLVVHSSVIEVAERLLGTPDIRVYQAQCMAKYTGATNYEQPLHVDYSTHTLLTPQPREQVEMFLYLCDVTDDLAPTHLVSKTLTRERAFVPKSVMPNDAPHLYAAEECSPGPAGSLLAYAPETWHRGVDLTRPGGARFWLALGYRVASKDWLGFQAFQRVGLRPEWTTFVEDSSPRELALFGIPPPGHAYWTHTTVRQFASRYPGLNVTPWRDAVEGDGR